MDAGKLIAESNDNTKTDEDVRISPSKTAFGQNAAACGSDSCSGSDSAQDSGGSSDSINSDELIEQDSDGDRWILDARQTQLKSPLLETQRWVLFDDPQTYGSVTATALGSDLLFIGTDQGQLLIYLDTSEDLNGSVNNPHVDRGRHTTPHPPYMLVWSSSAHRGSVASLSCDANAEHFASCGEDGTVHINAIERAGRANIKLSRLASITQSSPLLCCALKPDFATASSGQRLLATGNLDGALVMHIRLHFFTTSEKLHGGDGAITALSWAPQSSLVCWASDSGFRVVDVATNQRVALIPKPEEEPAARAFLPSIFWRTNENLLLSWNSIIKVIKISSTVEAVPVQNGLDTKSVLLHAAEVVTTLRLPQSQSVCGFFSLHFILHKLWSINTFTEAPPSFGVKSFGLVTCSISPADGSCEAAREIEAFILDEEGSCWSKFSLPFQVPAWAHAQIHPRGVRIATFAAVPATVPAAVPAAVSAATLVRSTDMVQSRSIAIFSVSEAILLKPLEPSGTTAWLIECGDYESAVKFAVATEANRPDFGWLITRQCVKKLLKENLSASKAVGLLKLYAAAISQGFPVSNSEQAVSGLSPAVFRDCIGIFAKNNKLHALIPLLPLPEGTGPLPRAQTPPRRLPPAQVWGDQVQRTLGLTHTINAVVDQKLSKTAVALVDEQLNTEEEKSIIRRLWERVLVQLAKTNVVVLRAVVERLQGRIRYLHIGTLLDTMQAQLEPVVNCSSPSSSDEKTLDGNVKSEGHTKHNGRIKQASGACLKRDLLLESLGILLEETQMFSDALKTLLRVKNPDMVSALLFRRLKGPTGADPGLHNAVLEELPALFVLDSRLALKVLFLTQTTTFSTIPEGVPSDSSSDGGEGVRSNYFSYQQRSESSITGIEPNGQRRGGSLDASALSLQVARRDVARRDVARRELATVATQVRQDRLRYNRPADPTSRMDYPTKEVGAEESSDAIGAEHSAEMIFDVGTIVSLLQKHRRALWLYLEKLLERIPSLCAPYRCQLILLAAEFEPSALLPVLQKLRVLPSGIDNAYVLSVIDRRISVISKNRDAKEMLVGLWTAKAYTLCELRHYDDALKVILQQLKDFPAALHFAASCQREMPHLGDIVADEMLRANPQDLAQLLSTLNERQLGLLKSTRSAILRREKRGGTEDKFVLPLAPVQILRKLTPELLVAIPNIQQKVLKLFTEAQFHYQITTASLATEYEAYDDLTDERFQARRRGFAVSPFGVFS